MQILLFIAYAALLCFLTTRSAFLVKSGLPKTFLAGLFLLYGLTGCAHLMIAFYYFPGRGDVWQMFNISVTLKDLWLHDYISFTKELFPDKFSVDLIGNHLGWSSYEQQGLVMLQILFNFLSLDNLYINTLLFSFLTMFGKVAFYRMLCDRYPEHRLPSLILSFLIPSVVFWTSVIHKEGILFSCLGVLFYCLQRFQAKKATIIILSLLSILVTRKVLLATLVPGLTIWAFASCRNIQKKYAIAAGGMAFCLLIMLPGVIDPSWSVLHYISERSQAFKLLTGGSHIYFPNITNTISSFVAAAPYAVLNGLFMPLPGTGGKFIYVLFSLEIVFVWMFIFRCMILKQYVFDGFTAGCFVFALMSCLLTGYIVPFAGALVRYRSIFYPFLLAPFVFNLGQLGHNAVHRRANERLNQLY